MIDFCALRLFLSWADVEAGKLFSAGVASPSFGPPLVAPLGESTDDSLLLERSRLGGKTASCWRPAFLSRASERNVMPFCVRRRWEQSAGGQGRLQWIGLHQSRSGVSPKRFRGRVPAPAPVQSFDVRETCRLLTVPSLREGRKHSLEGRARRASERPGSRTLAK